MTTHPVHPPAAATASGLAERYVHAATRGLPADQRDDVADELRASIADRVDALLADRPGTTTEDAERAALVELGDPARLAADYSGGQVLHLIGPDLYPSWWQTMRAVLVTVVPISSAAVAAIDAFTGASFGAIVGGAAWMAFTVTVQVAFWITLAFAIVERGDSSGDVRRAVGTPWTPDRLPEPPSGPRGSVAELVTNVVWLTFIGSAIVWQQVRSPIQEDGDRLPLLDPDLWSFWLPLVLVLLVAEAAYEVVRYRSGGWSARMAAVNAVVGAVFAAPVVHLAAGERLLNPAAVRAIQEDWPEFDPGTASWVVVVVALGIWLWDSVDGWRRTRSTPDPSVGRRVTNHC